MSLKELLVPALNRPPAVPKIAPLPEGPGIPRIIHQTFYLRDLPLELAQNVAHIKALNPAWEYRFYDDDDIVAFIGAHYPPVVLAGYLRISPKYGAARADLFRYLLMYKVGGVYLDIKTVPTRPLDTVLLDTDRYVLSYWQNEGATESWGMHHEIRDIAGGEFQQWYIICAPGHPALKAAIESVLANIDNYIPSLHGVGKKGVLRVTGPIAYTRAVFDHLPGTAHRMVDSSKDLGLQYNLYAKQAHQTAFKSHYSLQTAPVVMLGFRKRQLTHVYAVLQYLYHVLTGRPQPGP